jgi:hypothetical protein
MAKLAMQMHVVLGFVFTSTSAFCGPMSRRTFYTLRSTGVENDSDKMKKELITFEIFSRRFSIDEFLLQRSIQTQVLVLIVFYKFSY